MKRTVEVTVIEPAQKKFNVTVLILFQVLMCIGVARFSWDWFDMHQTTDPIPWGIAMAPGITIGSAILSSIFAICDYFENKKYYESTQ